MATKCNTSTIQKLVRQIGHFLITMPFTTIFFLHLGMLDYPQVESQTNQARPPMAVAVAVDMVGMVPTTIMVA